MTHVHVRTAARIYVFTTDFIVWAFSTVLDVNIGIVNKFALNSLHATVVQNLIYTYTNTHSAYVILYVDMAAMSLLSHEH